MIRWMHLFVILMGTTAALSRCSQPAPETASPAEVEAPEEALQRTLERLVEDELVAGAVGLAARNGEILFRGAAGDADRAARREMSPDHLFRIASMTKPITSVAAMILHDEGRLALDDPISKFLPSFAEPKVLETEGEGPAREVPARSEITVRHLLTHTSGIQYRFLAAEPLGTLYADAGIVDGLVKTERTLADQMKRLGRLPLAHEPGAGWTYGLNTDVLGAIIETVSGQKLDVFLEERIFLPLGMRDTRFFVPEEDRERLATVYQPDGAGGLEPIAGTVVDGPLLFSAHAVVEGRPAYLSGGAGLVSSADDYFRFCRMILNGGELDGVRVLKRETVARMLQNQIGELSVGLAEDKFGLGFSIAQRALDGIPRGVVGWGGFYGTEFWIHPETGIIAVFLAQVYDLPRRQEIVRRFGQEVFRTLAPAPSSD